MKLLPTRENHRCFGCSPTNLSGLHMRFYTDEKALYSWLRVPPHLSGWQDIVHGGVTTTILDEVMGWSAIYLLKTLVLTKSISVDFLKPVFIEQELRAEGWVIEKRGDREAVMKGLLFDSSGTLCSRARGVFALFTPEMAGKFGFDESAKWELERIVS